MYPNHVSKSRSGARFSFIVVLCLCVFTASFSGCIGKRKALVAAHNSVGELLLSTQKQAKALYAQKAISEATYNDIRINWLRAQAIYLKASDVLEKIIDNDSGDVSQYTELITQVSVMASDIALWLKEGNADGFAINNNPGIAAHPADNEVSGGSAKGSGIE